MKVIQALVLSIIHSFFANLLLILFNIMQYQDVFTAFATTSYLLYVNTLWSLVFMLVLGGGRRVSMKVFIAPFFSSVFTMFTLWLIGVDMIDFLIFYLILVFAGLIAVAVLYTYRRSHND